MKRLAVLLPLVLAACAGEDQISRYQPIGYLPEAEQISSQADWSNPDVIEMQLVNHAFVPDEITVRRNRPTRLILKNPSKSDHTFVGEQFMKSIAVRQLVGRDITATTAWVEKVVVPAGETKELWFVPTRYGAFTFECTVTGHALLGMKGVINVSN
ncbi:MAG: cupredoxin domain-containing protein [Rhodospirillaceae bacterium]|nr:cupredoxin domain-containing protein [Rhodospirillales bacterium]